MYLYCTLVYVLLVQIMTYLIYLVLQISISTLSPQITLCTQSTVHVVYYGILQLRYCTYPSTDTVFSCSCTLLTQISLCTHCINSPLQLYVYPVLHALYQSYLYYSILTCISISIAVLSSTLQSSNTLYTLLSILQSMSICLSVYILVEYYICVCVLRYYTSDTSITIYQCCILLQLYVYLIQQYLYIACILIPRSWILQIIDVLGSSIGITLCR